MDAASFRMMPPKMLCGSELADALRITPASGGEVGKMDAGERLAALSALYDAYVPSRMSMEIYVKLHSALSRSMEKKVGIESVVQRNRNMGADNATRCGISGGADSLSIIGPSGIGKSRAIGRAASVICGGLPARQAEEGDVIPFLSVQTPFDASVKQFLMEILRQVDLSLGTPYYGSVAASRSTTDSLIGVVSNVVMNHVGVLIADEIQNMSRVRKGGSLASVLTQLINNSGISICMVGTPECAPFMESEFHLARRSVGLSYGNARCDGEFAGFCREMMRFQYVRHGMDADDAAIEWLYAHSGGNAAVVVSLLHDAQEIAIMGGNDRLDYDALQAAYRDRLGMLHGHIAAPEPRPKKPRRTRGGAAETGAVAVAENATTTETAIQDAALAAKKSGEDVALALSKVVTIEEVRI